MANSGIDCALLRLVAGFFATTSVITGMKKTVRAGCVQVRRPADWGTAASLADLPDRERRRPGFGPRRTGSECRSRFGVILALSGLGLMKCGQVERRYVARK